MKRREEVLAAAADALGAHDETYGEPFEIFKSIAGYWNIHLEHRFGREFFLDGADVAAMMILLKLARFGAQPFHRDTIVDIAGYAACLGEIIDGIEKDPALL